MIAVVGRYPSKHRHAIEHREPPIGEHIERTPGPDVEVIVVMRDDRHGHFEVQEDKIKPPVGSIHPLIGEKTRGDDDVPYGANVCFVLEHAVDFVDE